MTRYSALGTVYSARRLGADLATLASMRWARAKSEASGAYYRGGFSAQSWT
jgi:hypothetical protein